MKRADKSRVIVGALVHGEDTNDVVHLQRCCVSFMGTAWGDYIIPKNLQTILLAEGKPRPGFEHGRFKIHWNTLAIAEEMIDGFENQNNTKSKGKKGTGKQVPSEPNILLTFGSKEFCQAWVHFWATSTSGEASQWGLHLIRRLTGMEIGEVAWYDSQDGSFHHDNIGNLYASMQEAMKKTG